MRKISREQFNSEKPFDSGGEKRVWIDPQNPEQKIGIYHGEHKSAPERIKGRFYFGKIMHLLCPDHIPDIHQANSDPNSLISDFVQGKNAEDMLPKIFNNKMSGDQIKFRSLMLKFGIDTDDSIFNFVYDQQGRFVYVDTMEPWYGRNSGTRNYSLKALQTAIEELDPKRRGEAFSYLNRLETLFAQQRRDKDN